MTWDNRDVLTPFGAAARAREVPKQFAPRSAAAPCGCSYPPTRDVPAFGVGAAATIFPRYQSAAATLAASTVFQEVVRFAGRPANITVVASASGVEFRLRNRGEEGTDTVRVLGTAPLQLFISKEIVEARDPAGAGGQVVTVQGMWTDADI